MDNLYSEETVDMLIAQLKEKDSLLRRAEEIIREVDLTPTWDCRGECCFCGKRAGAGHDKDCERLKAQALLPELEKALEKTP